MEQVVKLKNSIEHTSGSKIIKANAQSGGTARGDMFYYQTDFESGTKHIAYFNDIGTALDKQNNPTQIKYTFDQIDKIQFVLRTGSFSGTVVQSEIITCYSSDRYWKKEYYGLTNGTKYYYCINRKFKGFNWEEETGVFYRVYIGTTSKPTFYYNSSDNTVSYSSDYMGSNDFNILVVTPKTDNSPYKNKYSREARTLAWEACLQYTELEATIGKISNQMSVMKDQFVVENKTWIRPSVYRSEGRIYKFAYLKSWIHYVRVTYLNSTNKTFFEIAISNWISDINQLLGTTAWVRDDSYIGDYWVIDVTIGTHQQLWGYNPDNITNQEVNIFYGSWDINYFNYSSWSITSGTVKLCCETRGAMCSPMYFRNIVYEELTEMLGCGNDQFRNINSMFSEVWYVEKDNDLYKNNLLTDDGQVVSLLYEDETTLGMTGRDLVDLWSPQSSCCIQLEHGSTLDFLSPGKQYDLKMFAFRRTNTWTWDTTDQIYYWEWSSTNCAFTDLTSMQTITIPSNRPNFFDWDNNKISGNKVDIKYTEWNRLITNINDVRAYKGASRVSLTAAQKDQPITADMYNELVNAMKGISGFSYTIDTVSIGQAITAYVDESNPGNINKLVRAINSVR